jgi:iron complex transport system permease protein
MVKKKCTKDILVLLSLLVLLTLTILISFSIGRYAIPVSEILNYVFTGKAVDANTPTLLLDIRMPRILGAILVGGALAVSGAAYQGLFRNPVVSPDILGVSQGAGFGAASAILLSFGMAGIQLSAFAMGIFSVCLSLSISRITGKSRDRMLMLVLSGIIVGTLFNALISLMKYIADSEFKLPDITFWLMGSLSNITTNELLFIAPTIALFSAPLFLVGWQMNVISFGEDEARAMGVNTRFLRLVVIICSTFLTASAVSVTGLIGWIGLIIPHITRFITGPNYKLLFPASFLLGGTFLLWVDDLARTASSLEIPLGIITSLIGAPMFFIVLKMKK